MDQRAAQLAEVRQNYATFQAQLPNLVERFEGHFAVLRHAQLVDIFATFGKALEYCGATFDDRLFSIQEITAAPPEVERVPNAPIGSPIRPDDRTGNRY